jgi:predicted CoA-substrate-specific enzyme activase
MVEGLLNHAGVDRDDLDAVVATGWGRHLFPGADDRVTDVVSVARGAWELSPDVVGVIDVGGQDTKAIRIGGGGRVLSFALNDRCAAGTGRFLEVGMRRLGVTAEEFSQLASRSKEEVSISSFCTVFADSEIVALVARGTAVEDIARALEVSVVDRIVSLVGGTLGDGAVLLTGGLALNPDLVGILRERLGCEIRIPDEPQLVGALGAALHARDRNRR